MAERKFNPPPSKELFERSEAVVLGTILDIKKTEEKGEKQRAGEKAPYPTERMQAKVQQISSEKGEIPKSFNLLYWNVDYEAWAKHLKNNTVGFSLDGGPHEIRLQIGERYRFYLKPTRKKDEFIPVLDGAFDDGFSITRLPSNDEAVQKLNAVEVPVANDKSLVTFVDEFVNAVKKNDLEFVKRIDPKMPDQAIPSFSRRFKALIENAEQNQKKASISCDSFGVCLIEWEYTDRKNPTGKLMLGIRVVKGKEKWQIYNPTGAYGDTLHAGDNLKNYYEIQFVGHGNVQYGIRTNGGKLKTMCGPVSCSYGGHFGSDLYPGKKNLIEIVLSPVQNSKHSEKVQLEWTITEARKVKDGFPKHLPNMPGYRLINQWSGSENVSTDPVVKRVEFDVQ
ncbi:MAG TPA: hypothetical protein VI895_04060 [Bdellovibrionota bacterium]|nr:hypothetical protein [Bdellovibrionota bacterium]